MENPLKKFSNMTRLLVKTNKNKLEQSLVFIVQGNAANVYSLRVGLVTPRRYENGLIS